MKEKNVVEKVVKVISVGPTCLYWAGVEGYNDQEHGEGHIDDGPH